MWCLGQMLHIRLLSVLKIQRPEGLVSTNGQYQVACGVYDCAVDQALVSYETLSALPCADVPGAIITGTEGRAGVGGTVEMLLFPRAVTDCPLLYGFLCYISYQDKDVMCMICLHY